MEQQQQRLLGFSKGFCHSVGALSSKVQLRQIEELTPLSDLLPWGFFPKAQNLVQKPFSLARCVASQGGVPGAPHDFFTKYKTVGRLYLNSSLTYKQSSRASQLLCFQLLKLPFSQLISDYFKLNRLNICDAYGVRWSQQSLALSYRCHC